MEFSLEGKMKSFIVYLIVMLTAVVVGCAPVTRSNWEPTAWHVQKNKSSVPEIGTLQDEQFDYDIIVTDFRKVVKTDYALQESPGVTKHPKTLIAVAVRCQNKSNGTLILNADPIQMIDPFRTLAKKIDSRRSNIQTLWWKNAKNISIRIA